MMVSVLRKWWNGDYANRLAEAQQRIDVAPDGEAIPVDSDLVFKLKWPPPQEREPQKITVDNDIKEMKRALVMRGRDLTEGRVRILEVGPTCDGCGQTGIAYHRDGKTRILVCKPIKRAIDDLIFKQWHYHLEETKYSPRLLPFSPSLDSMIAGCPIESIECGRNLKMHLRMRFCWFD